MTGGNLVTVQSPEAKRVLIIYYSFSGQTQLLIQHMSAGMREAGLQVDIERLIPLRQISFPFRSWLEMASVMFLSFFRWRVPVRPIDHLLTRKWDCVVLAGPTWSYNPSGPMLYFLDRYGKEVCGGVKVLPLISCRSYWRTHYWCLLRKLKGCGAEVLEPLVYLHSAHEPWRTIGLFLQLVGRLPRLETSWFRKRYPRYGHSKEQWRDAAEKGRSIAGMLLMNVEAKRDGEETAAGFKATDPADRDENR